MSPLFEIRPATAKDADGILRLNAAVAAEAPYFLAYDIDPVSGAEMLRTKLSAGAGGDRVLVAGESDDIFGVGLLRRHQHPAFVGVLQYSVAVHPDWRQRGIGAALTDAAIRMARADSARRLQLALIDGNDAALKLFEGRGFSIEGRLIDAAQIAGLRHDVLAMGCALDALPGTSPSI